MWEVFLPRKVKVVLYPLLVLQLFSRRTLGDVSWKPLSLADSDLLISFRGDISDMDALLLQRLKAASSTISKILHYSETAGMSVGILHRNKVLHNENYGYQDLISQSMPDKQTVFYAASLTKCFTSAAIGILVEKGKLDWTTPVSMILPSFQHSDPIIREQATIADFLSHRSGMATENSMWYGDHNKSRIKQADFVKTTTSLRPFHPLRSKFTYNNWGYGLADQIIESISGKDYGTFLQERVIGPLDMSRTSFEVRPGFDNTANAYVYSGKGDPHPVAKPEFGTGTSMVGACGLKSCVEDLLKFYKALMLAAEDQKSRNATSTPGSPFKQLTTILKPHIATEPDAEISPHKNYTLGMFSLQLPGDISAPISDNGGLVKNFPVIGEGMRNPPLILFHSSALLGYLGCVILVPETQTTIVVLTNTLGLQDAPNWVAGLLLETLLDCPKKNDYAELAKEAAECAAGLFPAMYHELDEQKIHGTPMKAPKTYVGKFYNSVKTYYFDIFQEEGDEALWLAFCGDKSDKYKLSHYNYDVLAWTISYDEILHHQLWPIPDSGYYLLCFESDGTCGDLMDKIVWKCSWGFPGGDTYERDDNPT